MTTNPLELCQYDLPSGRQCRQVALKNSQVCRHHDRLYRHSETRLLHDQAMENLATCLRSLDTVTLLRTLHKSLISINRPIRKLPATYVTLGIVLERLDPATAPTPHKSVETPAESINWNDHFYEK